MVKTTLEPLIEVSKDGEWGKGEPFLDSVEMRVIRGTDFGAVRTGDVSGLPIRFIPRQVSDRKKLRPSDLLIETAGGSKDRPTGRTLYITKRIWARSDLPLTCASFSRFIRIKPKVEADPLYLFWHLQWLYETQRLLKYHTQHTGVSRFQWTTFSTREMLDLPDFESQKKIASILSAYDNLIENNCRRIKIMEEMAQSIYREWFVKFRFPGHQKVKMVDSLLGKIPEGWEVSEFRSIFDIKYGKTLPKTEISEKGLYPVYGAGDVIGYYDKVICQEKCALVTSRGNGSGTVWRTREAAFVTNNSLIILPQEKFRHWDYSFVELLLKHSNVMEAKTGSAQPQVTIENLNYVKAIVPLREIVERFCAFATSIYEQVDLLFEKNTILRQTRDLLLPKLISGELDVSELDITISEANA